MKIKLITVSDAKNIYIDVDGVLLCNRTQDSIDPAIAKYGTEFLEVCLEGHDCYWLTTHCRDGSVDHVIQRLGRYADPGFMKLARQIKPVTWNTLKTEAIDFTQPFVWVDDDPLDAELDVLRAHNCIHRWLNVNTWKKPDDLFRAMEIIGSNTPNQTA